MSFVLIVLLLVVMHLFVTAMHLLLRDVFPLLADLCVSVFTQGIARKGHYGAYLLSEPDVRLGLKGVYVA